MFEGIPIFPTCNASSLLAKSPLTSAIVRIVFGDRRCSNRAVKWNKEPTGSVSIKCSSQTLRNGVYSHGEDSAWREDLMLNSWVDFTAEDLGTFALLFEFRKKDYPRKMHTTLLGSELEDMIGVLHRPIIEDISGTLSIVGTLTISFLVITPFIRPENFLDAMKGRDYPICAENVQVSWFTGHRGMGKTKPHLLKENTVHSFLEASRNPYVNHVELDVQLTKDGYPVVYHDWFFRPTGRDNDTDRSNLAVPIYNLTKREFEELYASGVRNEAYVKSTESDIEECAREISDSTDVHAFLAKDKIRTLAEVCSCLPEDVGIMVEVKYPSPNVQQEFSINFPERNEIVDRVLHDLVSVEANARRSIIFLSFDPDICTLLSLKQNFFPVFFSYCDGRDRPCELLDPRCISIEQGINFAESNLFQGIMFWDRILTTDPYAVSMAKGKGLNVITYGASNSDPEWAAKQIKQGVDGIIADEVHHVAEHAVPLLADKMNCNVPVQTSRMRLSVEPTFDTE